MMRIRVTDDHRRDVWRELGEHPPAHGGDEELHDRLVIHRPGGQVRPQEQEEEELLHRKFFSPSHPESVLNL